MKRENVVVEKAFMYSNYFALFEIEPAFNIDLNELEKKYIELSRQFHPDINKGHCEKIININKAYKTLKSPLERAEHVLSLYNIESKEDNLNTEILHESMEIREYLMSCDDFQFASKIIDEKIKDCMGNLTNAFALKDFNDATSQVLRLKYLYKSFEEVKKNAANSNF